MRSEEAPFNVWLETGSHTFCPDCESGSILVMRTLTVTGPAILAGERLKFSGVEQWVFNCPDCGASGYSEPKAGN